MKFLKSHNVKYSTKLFQNKYKYKVVFTSGVAGWFRGSNVERINKFYHSNDDLYYSRHASSSDKNRAHKLASTLAAIENWQSRVETPTVSIYINTEKDLEAIVNVCKNEIKYIVYFTQIWIYCKLLKRNFLMFFFLAYSKTFKVADILWLIYS